MLVLRVGDWRGREGDWKCPGWADRRAELGGRQRVNSSGTGGSEVAPHCPGREKAAAQTTLGLWGQTRWKQMPLDGGLLSCFDHLLRVASPQSHFSRLQRCYGC